ncbi:hypothetical protein AB0284_19500 [Pseudarthrobacter phenanthrenivorans]|jgi:hypothetical protein|uniref:Uncharacterized protein n=1 Tax=Pseudarthrobacter phenanthrenivorans TaxID=361575 RepID=A0A0B4DEC9_PSEPS|nr:hypothetical protein [Pseudarthrobacter phenanthrenivorans]KIC67112.1 hypothetical protein RM50_09340 [Pseudarthrobacter phenanthrenivorans]
MDTGTILSYTAGYLAAMGGVFLLYLPVIVLLVALLIASGLLELLLLPFITLFRRLRRRPEPDMDPSWLLDRRR